MGNFRNQINEDIADYAERYSEIANMSKPEWAFNFWILDKLFSEDEELIEEKIVDYNDKGIDCYVWHEDLRDLYLIQNKFYSDDTKLTNDYVQNDFLTRSLGALEKGTYTRSPELQNIFSKYKDEEDFRVHLYLYVTNDVSKTQTIDDGIAKFNASNDKYDAKIFYLRDIEEQYYDVPIENKKSMSFDIETINGGTILFINTEAYKMTQALDARYVLTPVINLYGMCKKAKEKEYDIFDTNIREYLGSAGAVNKRIVNTLKSPEDRKNFFYYNNGVTVIVDDMTSTSQKGGNTVFTISNPKIVNGCQTVSTIFETLGSLPVTSLEDEFKDTYVMLKILKIPNNDKELEELSKNIVIYNNSQNSINQKTFEASASEFKRLQMEFERRGYLICIKQSDKHTFTEKYKSASSLIKLNSEIHKKFGLKEVKKAKDVFIDLEKFLQVILAFVSTPVNATQNKSKLLVAGSEQNKQVVEFIKNPNVSINDLLNLYLLYLKAEQEKKASDDGKMPIPFYLIYCFKKYECNNGNVSIAEKLSNENDIKRIITLYKGAISGYYSGWKQENIDKDYNTMIKSPLNEVLMDTSRKSAYDMLNAFM